MLRITFLALVLSVSNVFASEMVLPKCKVSTLKDAQKCIDKVAQALDEYEEPNEGMVSADKKSLLLAMKSIAVDERILRQVQAADFVGAVLQHGDEHQLYYYTFTKKAGIAPLCDLNVVDLDYSLVHMTEANNFFLGLDGAKFDAYEDIVYALKEFENKN